MVVSEYGAIDWNFIQHVRGLCTINNIPVISVTGCFDIFHLGHLKFLHFAKTQSYPFTGQREVLWVGLNSDESVRENKGNGRPINSVNDRLELLLGIRYVNYVTIFEDKRPDFFLEILKPDILVKSKQYDRPDSPSKKIVESYGGRVVYYDDIDGYSTTSLIERIKTNA